MGDLGDIARGDQAGAQMRTVAEFAATYYRSMIVNGIPEELAAELTSTWHFLFWRSSLWPNANPPDGGD